LRAELAPVLALIAGLAVRSCVAELLESAGSRAVALVKWPNDVVISAGKLVKLAGVLVESQVRGERLGAVVVGVGLNVGRLELPSELAETATSLALLGVNVGREELLTSVLRALDARLSCLENPEMPLETLVTELGRFDALKGMKVRVDELTGIAAGIDEEGCLKVVDATGTTHKVVSGHVTLEEE
jgi:BirA family transcriptional regulator, biotin operon repressor / biotin---[acetyl-CoA-carboxylase] ligase